LKKKEFLFVEDTIFNNSAITKTKQIIKTLNELNLRSDSKVLIILPAPNRTLWLATRNLKNIDLTVATCLNIKQLLKTNHIVLSNSSLELINSTYGKQYA
jgi:large subunit ribosomal protein L4